MRPSRSRASSTRGIGRSFPRYWKIAEKYDILNKMAEWCWIHSGSGHVGQLAIQGEIVGPGVNNNHDQYTDHEFRIFRMYDITDQRWLNPSDRRRTAEQMGIPHVKLIRDCWYVFQELKTMEDFLEFVKGKTDRGHEREGMVWKSVNGMVSFKVINNDYLLKEK